MNVEFIRGILVVVLLGTVVGWIVRRTIRSAEDPARIAFKWGVTLAILAVLFFGVAPIVGRGGYTGAFVGIPATAVCGLFLAILWGREIGALVARPLTSLFTGGEAPPEPKPVYSIARALQKKGKVLEAIVEIRKQLAQFPDDLEGHLLLAEIQARDQRDMQSAETTIQRFCSQPGHPPQTVAGALYALADWHLAIGRDQDAARRVFEQVRALYPNSELELGAAQRISHLGDPEMMLEHSERRHFQVQTGPGNRGLGKHPPVDVRDEKTPADQAAAWVEHLQKYPQDNEAREKLAILYTDHYQRLDLATDQLEQMISEPHQPQRLVVHWLNLLADLQIRGGCGYEAVRGTLERIIERYPAFAPAENARKRIELLKLELRAREVSSPVRMGVYEQNLGLKPGFQPPSPPH